MSDVPGAKRLERALASYPQRLLVDLLTVTGEWAADLLDALPSRLP